MLYQVEPHTLHFKQPAGTARGVYRERKVWYVVLTDENNSDHRGVGECAPLPDLSCDAMSDEDYIRILSSEVESTIQTGRYSDYLRLKAPSMLFGIETALWQYRRGTIQLSDTPFARGEEGIRINGLIWMGTYDEMKTRIEEKLRAGFACVKLKIGAINFDDEIALLQMIRRQYPSDVVELRVDANGAFQPGDDALRKLDRLSHLDLHSIEQPIRAGQWEAMADLCRRTPLPIALDEELISVNLSARKEELLDTIHPQYIILKPSLHGGIIGSDEWIALAEQRNIGWWATSALESNVGLNAIAHWCAQHRPTVPQGLGTGQLFTDNIPYPLMIKDDRLYFRMEQCATNG